MAKIINLPKITEIDQTSGSIASFETEEGSAVRVSTSEPKAGPEIIDTEDLYPLHRELSIELSAAFALLSEGTNYISEAIAFLNHGDPISADDSIQRFQALLPELFCCRTLSDGFGAIINALFHSLNNLRGIPLTLEQMSAIRMNVERLKSEPYIEFDEAVDVIMKIEDSGLDVEPEHFKFAADLLNE